MAVDILEKMIAERHAAMKSGARPKRFNLNEAAFLELARDARFYQADMRTSLRERPFMGIPISVEDDGVATPNASLESDPPTP